jgi:predicted anti-sigma-YlaC factor YlaD
MNCEEYQELVNRKLDGDISIQEASLLDEHLKKCGPCGEYLRLFASLSRADIAPSEDFEERIMCRLERKEPVPIERMRKSRHLLALAMAAGVVLAAVAILFAIAMLGRPLPEEQREIAPPFTTISTMSEGALATAGRTIDFRAVGTEALRGAGTSLKQSAQLIRPKPVDIGKAAEQLVGKDSRTTLKHDYELTRARLKSFYDGMLSEINFL